MVFQLMSAVALFVVIAVALYFQIPDEQFRVLLAFVRSFAKPFANLMEYKFFQFMVDDTVFYIVTYIGNSVGVVVFNMTIWNRWPEVHAQAGVEQNTTAPEISRDTRAPVIGQQMAQGPGPVVSYPDAPPAALGDPVEPVGQSTNSFGRWQHQAPVPVPVVTAQFGLAAGNNWIGPAPESVARSIIETSRCVMVQQNARKAEREARETEKKRRLDAAAAQRR